MQAQSQRLKLNSQKIDLAAADPRVAALVEVLRFYAANRPDEVITQAAFDLVRALEAKERADKGEERPRGPRLEDDIKRPGWEAGPRARLKHYVELDPFLAFHAGPPLEAEPALRLRLLALGHIRVDTAAMQDAARWLLANYTTNQPDFIGIVFAYAVLTIGSKLHGQPFILTRTNDAPGGNALPFVEAVHANFRLPSIAGEEKAEFTTRWPATYVTASELVRLRREKAD